MVVQQKTKQRQKSVNNQRQSQLTEQPDLLTDTRLNHVSFEFDLDDLQTEHPKLTEKHVQAFIIRIKKLIPKLPIHCDILSSVLSDKSFSIKVISLQEAQRFIQVPSDSSQFASGYYRASDHSVGIHYKHNISNYELKRILTNEFHHAASGQVNRLLLGSKLTESKKKNSVLVALDNNGEIDYELAEQLINAFEDGKVRLSSFIWAANAKFHGVRLEKVQELMLKKLEQSASNYTPKLHITEMSLEVYSSLSNAGYLRKNQQQLFLTLQLPVDDSRTFNKYISQVEREGNIVQIHYTHANDESNFQRGYAAMLDIYFSLQQYADKTYGINPTVVKDDLTILTEILSTIEEYPQPIKRLVFPEICNYMSEYHEVDNYCAQSCSNFRI